MVRERSRFVFLGTLPKIKFGYVSNGDIMVKEELTHKVYLATFSKPRYVMDIGELIYDVKKDTYPKLMGKNGAIKKCLKRGWIKDVTDSIEIPDPKPQGFEKRRYYKANIDTILDHILYRKILGELDEYVIKKISGSKAFEYLISKHFFEDLKINRKGFIDAFEYILSHIDILIIICGEYNVLEEQSKELYTIQAYDKALKKNQGNKKLMDNLEKIIEKLFEEDNLPREITEDALSLFIIPDSLKLPVPLVSGLSEFGRRYYFMKPVIDGFAELFEP